MRQEIREMTSTGKIAKAKLKQIETRKFQAIKKKMQIQKQLIIEEIVHELQAIKNAHMETIEAQKEWFLIEMEKLKKKLKQIKDS